MYIQYPPCILSAENSQTWLKTLPDVVEATRPSNRPLVVLETWDGRASLWPYGPATKGEKVKWHEVGYVTRCREIKATQVGGAV